MSVHVEVQIFFKHPGIISYDFERAYNNHVVKVDGWSRYHLDISGPRHAVVRMRKTHDVVNDSAIAVFEEAQYVQERLKDVIVSIAGCEVDECEDLF